MKRMALVLLVAASVSAAASASDYDLYLYDEGESVLYDSSESAGVSMEQVLYTNQTGFEETVTVLVEQDPLDPDTAGLGFYLEIWIDGTLTYSDDQGVGDVAYYQAVPSGSTVEAYMWPVSEWTVETIDFDDDFADGWDGFAITITVEGVAVFDESNYGEVIYPFEVLDGDEIDVELVSVLDDYDIELYDGYGNRVNFSDLAPVHEPDWITATVGGTSSGGRESSGGDDAVVVFCGGGISREGGGNVLGLVFPAMIGLFGLRRSRCLRGRAVRERA